LVPLALHERFIDADYLEAMARVADASHSRAAIDQLLTSLEIAGLLHAHGQGIYALHPALTGFLRAHMLVNNATDTAWKRAFVDVMGRLANQVAPKLLHVQRPFFALHSANFYTALTAAEQVGMDLYGAALAQALAIYAQNQRDFAQAEQWYRKSLPISEKLGDEDGAAIAYHQLGRIALDQRDFAQAEQWYRKSLAISEKLGDELLAASTYHQLGNIALNQRDFAQAGQWLMRSIVICLRYNDRYHLQMVEQNFLNCYAQAPPAVQATLKALWEDAGLGPLPAENAQE
jgi:tetratricopeptide (TPR) repeat protein